MGAMAFLDKLFFMIAPFALAIAVAFIVVFTVAEIGIFFFDRKERKKHKE